jgi:hypothetical protein
VAIAVPAFFVALLADFFLARLAPKVTKGG